MQDDTVQHFYNLLNNRDFKPPTRSWLKIFSAPPFEGWAGAYTNTIRTDAEVTPDPSAIDTLRVALTAIDRTAAGGQEVRKFTGTRKLL